MRLSAYETYRTLQEARHAGNTPEQPRAECEGGLKALPGRLHADLPEFGSTSRAIIRDSVDFPQPETGSSAPHRGIRFHP
jgi:hypothetical protein